MNENFSDREVLFNFFKTNNFEEIIAICSRKIELTAFEFIYYCARMFVLHKSNQKHVERTPKNNSRL